MQGITNLTLKSEKALAYALKVLGKRHEDIGVPNLPSEEPKPVEEEDVERRYEMLYRISRAAIDTKEIDEHEVKKVFALSQKDDYFNEIGMTEAGLQTIGYMKQLRNDWDLLGSVDMAMSPANEVKFQVSNHLSSRCYNAVVHSVIIQLTTPPSSVR